MVPTVLTSSQHFRKYIVISKGILSLFNPFRLKIFQTYERSCSLCSDDFIISVCLTSFDFQLTKIPLMLLPLANLPKLGQLSPMYEAGFSRPPWPTAFIQYIFPECCATGWVYLHCWFISPGLICLKYPTDRSHSWHPWKHFIRFYGLAGFGHHKFHIPQRAKESWIRN